MKEKDVFAFLWQKMGKDNRSVSFHSYLFSYYIQSLSFWYKRGETFLPQQAGRDRTGRYGTGRDSTGRDRRRINMKDEPILLAYKTGERLEVLLFCIFAEACLPLQFLVSLFIITTNTLFTTLFQFLWVFIVHCFSTCKCLFPPCFSSGKCLLTLFQYL